jgi:drug/metabolite transporter (DMT)-like permease
MKLVIGFTVMIACTVAANLLMKLGAESPAAERFFGSVSWMSIAGFGAFGCALMVYAWLLPLVPLNVAQSLAAAQFVAVVLASSFMLAEAIPPLRWVGIALIVIGILIVGSTVDAHPGSSARPG